MSPPCRLVEEAGSEFPVWVVANKAGDQLRITITGYRGSRHFSVGEFVRRAILVGAISLGGVLLLGGLVIALLGAKVGHLNDALVDLETSQAAIDAENLELLALQTELETAVAAKSTALAELDAEMGQIESLMGLSPEPVQTMYQRMDAARQSAQEKQAMLQMLPSGSPLQATQVTSGYGVRHHPIRKSRAMHWGLDLRAARGTPVHATGDGVVEWAGLQASSGLGKMVKLVHNYGFSSIYGHLNSVEVEAGSVVRQGQLLGYSGSTGRSSGPHLHYEVRYLQRRLDPTPFFNWSMDQYQQLFVSEEYVPWESLAETISQQMAWTAPTLEASPASSRATVAVPPSSQPAPVLSVISP